jgi:hypothetical protein
MKQYLIRVLNGMALGLFSSLIIGVIIEQLGVLLSIEMLIYFGQFAKYMMGPAIGAAVAYSVGASQLGIFASIVTGVIGSQTAVFDGSTIQLVIGEPVGAFVASLAGAEFSKLIQGKTKVDIVLVPAATIIAGGIVGIYLAPVITQMMTLIGSFINYATELRPFTMGIIIAVVMGMMLTLPVSSAAIAISLKLSGLAAGAATIGCCAQMVGFAIISYRENKVGGLIAQGIGTSMLQVPNIIKNPKIWIPPIIASAILGPVGTVVFKMENDFLGAGMGTAGLVGQLRTLAVMGNEGIPGILLLHFILPAILTLIISEYMRKKGWIKFGDMTLKN